MKNAICKIIVYIAIIFILGLIYAILMFKDKEATMGFFAAFGMFCLGGCVVIFVEWLFKDKESVGETSENNI